MQTSLARIFVKNTFCIQCVDSIKTKIMEVQNITNVMVYPSDALVVFNFKRANQISEVLNTLTILGYPPLEDVVETNQDQNTLCHCVNSSLAMV